MVLKTIGAILIRVSILGLIFFFVSIFYADYRWEKEIGNYWSLADKSSTLDAKSDYIDKFVEALEKAKLAEYNAIFFKTPNNNVRKNIEALKTLQARLHEIKSMDINSFAYQTAIEQITAQEQGEADKMLEVIEGGWVLANYPYVWSWFGLLILGVIILIGIIGIYSWIYSKER